MALAHAILASLLHEPSTGYDLAKKFGADGYFWRATHQQIYRELTRLESDGLIAPVSWPAGPRGERRRAITPAGRDQLASWGAEPTDAATIKEDMLVKCLAIELIDPAVLAAQITERREQHLERLRRHERTLASDEFELQSIPRSRLGEYLAATGGVAYERAWIAWADGAIRALWAVSGTDEASSPPTG